MQKRLLFLLCILCVILMTACGHETESQSDEQNPPDKSEIKKEQTQKTDHTAGKIEDNEKEKEDKMRLGDMEVKMSGEVIVSDDGIKVEGKSNLLPGLRISSHGVNDAGFASIAAQDVTEVQKDGSFTFDFERMGNDTIITLQLYKDDRAEEHYGEHLEKVTGLQKYITAEHGEFQVKVDFEVNVSQETPYTIPLEIPNWDMKPDDYGAPEVWMEAEVDSDHRYLYFRGKSNMMEGSMVGGNLRKQSGIIEPFSFGHTHVNPDGSFELRVPYHTLRQGMYMPIRFEPDRNSWDDVVAAYGENGEHLKGDLVGKEDNQQYVELIVPIDAPDFDPPEDVGLTVEEEEIKIQMPDHLLFDFDESKLKTEAKKTLDDVIQDLKKLDESTEIHINGHTDNVGDSDYNLKLSEERANAVWDYLKEQVEVEKFDVQINGFGDKEPIASNEDEKGQQKNRRVEIVINPK